MPGVLDDRRILLGVCGGIAAYKVPALVRAMQAEGAEVRAVSTRAASRFVSPLVLETLTGRAVVSDPFELLEGEDGAREIAHTELGRWADALLVAPATAQTLARLALGLADDAVSLCALASDAPLVVCPSMNPRMLSSGPVRRNLETLASDRRVTVVRPDAGELACGDVGPGRLPDPPHIVSALRRAMGPRNLEGTKVLVTAGPTREAIDAVRVLTNRSSGRMGVAFALAAWEQGADVVLVHGPMRVEPPQWVGECIAVESAAEMAEAVRAHIESCDALFMTAAVADWTPAHPAQGKRKKGDAERWSLELVRTPDVLGATRGLGRALRVGFAAETHDEVDDLLAEGRRKLHEKELDFIVVNRVGPGARHTGFATATNGGWLLSREGIAELPVMPKRLFAHEVLARVGSRVGG